MSVQKKGRSSDRPFLNLNLGKNNVMANSNNICTRFINYVAVLILLFLSSSVNASSFGGGGAGGSWDDPKQCPPQIRYTFSNYPTLGSFLDKNSAAASIASYRETQDNINITSYTVGTDNFVSA